MSSGPAPSGGGAEGGGKVSEALARVEKDLAALWQRPDEKSGQSKTRAAMLNLVVVAPSGDPGASEGALREATDRFTESHPGRVFLLSTDMRAEPWALRHEVSAACRAEGGQVLCSDRVELAFGSMAASRARSVVAALALPEVPTVVECRPGAARALVAAVAPDADRLVIDSASTSWKGIGEMLKLASGKQGRAPALADRQYLREQPWRRLVAQAFDALPAATRAIRRVAVTCTPAATAAGASRGGGATLLLAWLAARLGWTLESKDRARDAAGQPVELVRSEATHADVGPGELVSVEIEATTEGAPLSVEVKRAETPWTLAWSARGAQQGSGRQSLARHDEVHLLVQAIDSRAARTPGAAQPGREQGAAPVATFDAVYAETARLALELDALLRG